MLEFAQEEEGKKQSSNTSQSWDSASGLFRTSIFIIFKSSPRSERNSRLHFAGKELETLRGCGTFWAATTSTFGVKIQTWVELMSTLFHTAFWDSLISYPLEVEISWHLSKALLGALLPRKHPHIFNKGERGPKSYVQSILRIH